MSAQNGLRIAVFIGNMFNKPCKWFRETDGVTGLEYALFVAVIGLATAAASFSIGDDISSIFSEEAGLKGFFTNIQ